MRLKTIRLAGFKSFVDPTTVALPGRLMAVVGPNGCGKSNVIDAVRWVMGESSAKHLRGGSMADVIFNGSNARKPVGNAAIELVFDNSAGSLGGQYAAYAELAVKRQVSRDGQSVYLLNGTRCRKRDITDVFLGTGLGPRSYSIIEQGMISQLIEARSDDLRGYLEEAAGISLYKERRRETERRLRDTAENLERLDDVRDEVATQLERLEKQAETAERYRRLKAEERSRRAELYCLRLRALEHEQRALHHELNERETDREGETAKLRELEREAETLRGKQSEEGEQVNEIQARYYSLSSEIARVEQQIQHRRELRESADRELAENRQAESELSLGWRRDREALAELDQQIAALEPALADLQGDDAQARERLAATEQDLSEWRQRWEAFNQRAAEPLRSAEAERARIEQLDRREGDIRQRRHRLADEAQALDLQGANAAVTELAERETRCSEAAAQHRASRDDTDHRLSERDEQVNTTDDERASVRAELAREQGRLSSLETLQRAALGDDDAVTAWLESLGSPSDTRLAHYLTVAPGWERAVEHVLGQALQAPVLPREAIATAAALGGPPTGCITLVAASGQDAPGDDASGTLAACVTGHSAATELLRHVYTADDAATAQREAAELPPGYSVITPTGLWLGAHWLQCAAQDRGDEASVLARERELASVGERVRDLEAQAATLDEALAERRRERDEAVAARDRAAAGLAEAERVQADTTARLNARRDRADELALRSEAIATERETLETELVTTSEDLAAARRRLDEALAAGERLAGERGDLETEHERLASAVEQARAGAAAASQAQHERALELERARTSRTSAASAIARTESQHERLREQQRALEERLSSLDGADEDLPAARQTLLEQRVAVESELSTARARLGEFDTRLRELETNRTELQRDLDHQREALENARYREHELKVRAQTQSEQLAELEVERDTVEAELPAQAEPAAWAQELERLEARLQRLGAINLAAIEERAQLAQRKDYLDAQHADLSEAMETLQTAIRRIDGETRQRFRDTFERANTELQRLFPRLFGGGEAYLELTGEDLLDTGVTIMARPPGKKISNIHLLSGGEKALSAVALVFALFELNPSPFCMLDEVDAPLDDANVGRFCDLLVEMAERVQFVVITHNKTTMEVASHLTGVTMQEPGVSRLVAVDVDAVAELAAS